jgi:hypothetical protein
MLLLYYVMSRKKNSTVKVSKVETVFAGLLFVAGYQGMQGQLSDEIISLGGPNYVNALESNLRTRSKAKQAHVRATKRRNVEHFRAVLLSYMFQKQILRETVRNM